MEINREEFEEYLIFNKLIKENQKLSSYKLRTDYIKGIGYYIDYNIIWCDSMDNVIGQLGRSVILSWYLSWLREYKINKLIKNG